jgi:hypothetical protein
MPRYRVHILDSSGKVIGAGQFDCVNSETAQARIKRLAGHLETELWQLVSPFESGIKPCSEANQAKPRIRRRLHS